MYALVTDGTCVWATPSKLLTVVKMHLIERQTQGHGSVKRQLRPALIQMTSSAQDLDEHTRVYLCYVDGERVHVALNG